MLGGAEMSPEILKILCDYSLALVTLRQNEVKHLAVENIGPEMLAKVLAAFDGKPCPNELREVV